MCSSAPEMIGALDGPADLRALLLRFGWPIVADAPVVATMAKGGRKVLLHPLVVPDGRCPIGVVLLESDGELNASLAHDLVRTLDDVLALQSGGTPWQPHDLVVFCTAGWRAYQIMHVTGGQPRVGAIASFGWSGPDDPLREPLCRHHLARLKITPGAMRQPARWRAACREAFDSQGLAAACAAALRRVLDAAEQGARGVPDEVRRSVAEALVVRLLLLRFAAAAGRLPEEAVDLAGALRRHGAHLWRDWLVPLCALLVDTPPAGMQPRMGLRGVGTVPGALDVQVSEIAVEVFEEWLNGLPGRWPAALPALPPGDQAVAFTPDLLGDAYELLVLERKARGVYYTHTPDVSLMCAESLRAYLERCCPDVAATQIIRLVHTPVAEASEWWRDSTAQALTAALRDVTIYDPALGAGAFVVAMLRLLGTVHERLGNADSAAFRRSAVAHQLYGCDIDHFAVQVARLRVWCELLATDAAPAPLPCLERQLFTGDALVPRAGHDIAGTLVSPHDDCWLHRDNHPQRQPIAPEQPGFDIVIGNPPYLRQERLAGASGIDKQELRRMYRHLTGVEIAGQADLYVYFFLCGLLLAREHGLICYVTPNSWLDASYGAGLRSTLVEHGTLRTVIESRAACWFAQAEINTVITLFERGRGPDSDHMFVACAHPLVEYDRVALAQWIARGESSASLRVTRVAPGRLRRDGQPWGGMLLRAPDVYRRVIDGAQARLAPLSSMAQIWRGVTTGANEFFFLYADGPGDGEMVQCYTVDGTEACIERRYLWPAVLNTRECEWHVMTPDRAAWRLFACDDARAALAGTGALRYIEWGEERGYQRRATCAPRARWWSVRARHHAPIWWPIAHHDRDLVLLNDGVTPSDNFFAVMPREGVPPLLLLGLLLSSWVTLQREIVGRVGFGGGLLKTQGPDVRRLALPFPAALAPGIAAAISEAMQALLPLAPLRIQSAWDCAPRRALDEAVAAALSMPGEAAAIAEAAAALVGERVRRKE